MTCWLAGGLLFLLIGSPTNNAKSDTQQPNSPVVRSEPSILLGSVQLDLEPRRAQVFVDGASVGRVDDFSGYYHQLRIPAGLHHIEVLASGYMPFLVDVMVVPDRTITYRQSLQEAPHGS
jgi:hypothetical protein